MPDPAPPCVDPPEVPTEAFLLPETLDLSFAGFFEEAFAILDRLKAAPHIGQYRLEKPAVKRYLTDPFRRYRDDLVVNWVLPNRLGFETERNVFSRLLKNDFGAGGCHHHLWMSFYRPGLKRLTDFQLTHSLSPAGLTLGLYVGDYAEVMVQQARRRIVTSPAAFLAAVNPVLAREGWRFVYYRGAGRKAERFVHEAPMQQVPEAVRRSDALWLRTVVPRARVVAQGGALVSEALEGLLTVWPLYRFLAAGGMAGASIDERIHD